jgi:hypothetical protein
MEKKKISFTTNVVVHEKVSQNKYERINTHIIKK